MDTPGSYTCDCRPGYTVVNDRLCKGNVTIFSAMSSWLFNINLHGMKGDIEMVNCQLIGARHDL